VHRKPDAVGQTPRVHRVIGPGVERLHATVVGERCGDAGHVRRHGCGVRAHGSTSRATEAAT